jgi:hypothetical protein
MDSKNNKMDSLSPEEELENFKQNFLQRAGEKLSRSESEKL